VSELVELQDDDVVELVEETPRESALVRRARRGRALDLLEWGRAFGTEPVSKEVWARTLLPELAPRAAYRRWLRLREHWARDGVDFRLVQTTSTQDPARRVLVQITPKALEWARNVLDTGDDMLTTEPTRPTRAPAPPPSAGPHAFRVWEAAGRYLAAVDQVRAGGLVDEVLVRELLSLAAWFPDLGAPLYKLAEDFWGVGAELLPRIAHAAGLRVYKCRNERWVRRDEAGRLLAELLDREASS